MNVFERIPIKSPKRNRFNLSNDVLLTGKLGKLYPILSHEVVPGDLFSVNSDVYVKLQPLIFPVMHKIDVYTHYFFVPKRLVWKNFDTFLTGGHDGAQKPLKPYFDVSEAIDAGQGYFEKGNLADFFDIPIIPDSLSGTISGSHKIDSTIFRAYYKIWYEYYRDQNLDSQPTIYTDTDGQESALNMQALLELKTRCWERDYFTSCLPNTQFGESSTVPLQVNYKSASELYTNIGNSPSASTAIQTNAATPRNPAVSGTSIRIENLSSLLMSLAELRKSVAIQKFAERLMRSGHRLTELIQSVFGVTPPDARLQRPEYLGGGKQPVIFSEVLNNASITGEEPLGSYAGHGYSLGQTNRFKKFFTEHGYIIGIMSIIPRTSYSQGLPRMFTRFDRLDYYWPDFANLTEQEVKNKELYFDPTLSNMESTFGYQMRYAEYKYKPSSIHGDFRDTMADFHFSRLFSSQPGLNDSFVKVDNITRPFAVSGTDQFLVNVYNRVKALRPMPYFSVPSL